MNTQPAIDLNLLSSALSKLKNVLHTESFLKDVGLSDEEKEQLSKSTQLVDELKLVQHINQETPPGGFITRKTAQSRKNINRLWINLLPTLKEIGILRDQKPLESSVKHYKKLLEGTNDDTDRIVIRNCIKVVDNNNNEIDFNHINDLRRLIDENSANVRLNYLVFLTDGTKPKFKGNDDVLDDMRPCSPCEEMDFE